MGSTEICFCKPCQYSFVCLFVTLFVHSFLYSVAGWDTYLEVQFKCWFKVRRDNVQL